MLHRITKESKIQVDHIQMYKDKNSSRDSDVSLVIVKSRTLHMHEIHYTSLETLLPELEVLIGLSYLSIMVAMGRS